MSYNRCTTYRKQTMLFVQRTENSEKYINTLRNCSIYSLLIEIYFLGGNARFLAHDIEEDDEDMKLELYIWALGLEWHLHYKEMLTSRDVLWKVIGYRGIVSTACCEEVCTE